MINLVIVTGVYGAGKTLAAQTFEEAGYYVTDNIPLSLVNGYLSEIEKDPVNYENVCLTVDNEIALETYNLAKNHKNIKTKFFGITCSKSILNERYRLTRKIHPKQPRGVSLEKAIENDIEAVKQMRDNFDYFIDTSKLTPKEFRNVIYDYFISPRDKFAVSFISFGYKISVPQDIETVFDVRVLPNPFWVPELKNKTGLDQDVKDFILKSPITKNYLKHVIEYLDYYLDELEKGGNHHSVIGLACSGGQHRSVVVAEYLANHYSQKYHTSVTHKDIAKK